MIYNIPVSKPNCNGIQMDLICKVTNSLRTWLLVGPLLAFTCVRGGDESSNPYNIESLVAGMI